MKFLYNFGKIYQLHTLVCDSKSSLLKRLIPAAEIGYRPAGVAPEVNRMMVPSCGKRIDGVACETINAAVLLTYMHLYVHVAHYETWVEFFYFFRSEILPFLPLNL